MTQEKLLIYEESPLSDSSNRRILFFKMSPPEQHKADLCKCQLCVIKTQEKPGCASFLRFWYV